MNTLANQGTQKNTLSSTLELRTILTWSSEGIWSTPHRCLRRDHFFFSLQVVSCGERELCGSLVISRHHHYQISNASSYQQTSSGQHNVSHGTTNFFICYRFIAINTYSKRHFLHLQILQTHTQSHPQRIWCIWAEICWPFMDGLMVLMVSWRVKESTGHIGHLSVTHHHHFGIKSLSC